MFAPCLREHAELPKTQDHGDAQAVTTSLRDFNEMRAKVAFRLMFSASA